MSFAKCAVLCDWWNSLRWSVRHVLPSPRRRRLLRALRNICSKDDDHAKEAWKHSNGNGHDDGHAMGNGVHEPVSGAGAGAGLFCILPYTALVAI